MRHLVMLALNSESAVRPHHLIGLVLLFSVFGCTEEKPIAEPCTSDIECLADHYCVGGQCQSCPACAEGEVCLGNRCLPAACGDEPCHTGYGCIDGTCRSAECLEADCGPTSGCVRGTCYPRDCGGGLCGASEVCDENAQCTFLGCLGVTCVPGELCADGACYEKTCTGVTCAEGAACYGGRCVAAACIGVDCGPDALCVSGRCAPVSCDGTPCAAGQVCRDGRCQVVGCIGLSCPGQRCEPATSTCAACLAAEAHCRDGQDDDCDGKTDCQDSDCWGPNDCNCGGEPSETRCADGIDDDCDGLVDCADTDCLGDTCEADPCVVGSQCAADGTCLPGSPKPCDAPPGACHQEAGTCAPTTGDCQYAFKPEGTACPNEGNPCTTDTCDTAGVCVHDPLPNGTSCGTSGQTCSGGLCNEGVTPIAGTASVTGTARVGQVLTAVPAGFSLGTPAGAYSYTWQRCTTTACTSTTAVGGNSSTYTLVAADVNRYMRVGIKATNTCSSGCGSSATAQSAATGVVQGIAPSAGSVSVSGTAVAGNTLTASPSGFNRGTPTGSYTYVWQRCTTSSCSSATTVGGNSSTYTLASGDGGYYVRVRVYVSNSCTSGCGASSTVSSSALGPVKRVTLSKGDSCQYVYSTCTNSACRWYSINAVGFAAGSHTVTCNAANLSNPWNSFSASSFPVNGRCCYGYPGQGTWATVDGIRSNTLTW